MTCKDCIHYAICVFHTKGNENKKCAHFKNKADFVKISKETIIVIKDEWFMLNTKHPKLGEAINECVKYLIKDARRGDADDK